jgi:phospholipase/carboxylesterase
MALRDDLPLHYILSTPSGRPESDELPLVVVMHGRGADAHDLAEIAPMIDRGYRFLFPNAPKAWEASPGMTFGFTWFDGWPPEGNSLAESRAVVLAFIDAALEKYPTPEGKLIISGFSQGGLMSLDLGFRMETPVAGIVAMSGALNERDMPDLDAHKDRPVLITHGIYDDVVPALAAHRTRRILEQHGIDVEYHEFPMGHAVSVQSLAVVSEFTGKVLGKT